VFLPFFKIPFFFQIFGRAGRPQFDTSGHGTIITAHDKLSHYLSLLTNQVSKL
jgi:replicative superfamily II helicase